MLGRLLIATIATAVAVAAPASADPVGAGDPHHPNYITGWCPGHGVMAWTGVSSGICDGAPYPDGTFWRMSYQPGAFWGHKFAQWCQTDFDGAWHDVAERGVGACGGEW